jgi:hypothetical protein
MWEVAFTACIVFSFFFSIMLEGETGAAPWFDIYVLQAQKKN